MYAGVEYLEFPSEVTPPLQHRRLTKMSVFATGLTVGSMCMLWTYVNAQLTPSSLRGDTFEIHGRMMTNHTEELEDLPVLFFVFMPFVSALIGWFTNKVALKMTFYPYTFWGWEVKRFHNQPVGLFGWQGIVPTKAAKMAADSVDLMTTKVFNMQEIFRRIDKEKAASHMKEGFGVQIDKFINTISTKYIINESTAWKRTEAAVKNQIKQWALDELPSFTYSFMDALVDNLDDVYDLKHMCVTEMTEHPELLVSVFESVGKKELQFIEHSGAYFGFLFGLIQTLLFAFAIPAPYSDYLLPFLGFLVGYATNYIALWMIFKPVFPKKICCGAYTMHGLFLKRQKTASKQFAIKMVDTVLHSVNIWHYMLHGKFCLSPSPADNFVPRSKIRQIRGNVEISH